MTGTTVPYRVTSPVTGEVLEEFPHLTDAEVDALVARAALAQKEWASRPISERAAIVAAVGELFAKHAERLGAIATTEMGKPIDDAVGEVQFCHDIFGYYASEGPGLLADQELPVQAATARIQRLPIGPVLGIMPWNFPYYQVARFAAPNLVAGNTVVLKHAESCPRSALAIAELMLEAGVPDGVYVNVFATHDQVARIIADPRVQGVSLTGSERAGAAVAEIAGRHLKKVVLELGGSDPYVVLDTDDVRASAWAAWRTRLYNAGQACNSNKRMIVMADVYDAFVEALVEEARGLEPGDPAALADGTFAPMSSRAAAEALAAQVQDAVEQGATLHVGGVLVDGPGAYFRPAVLTGVTPAMRAYREELFGPVAVVYRVESDDDAVRLANDSQYGLGGAVFSTDPARAAKVADALEVGMTNVNTAAGEGASMPFGGVKRSGFGRELGPLGIDEFVNKRLHYVQR
ncbi:NAD-dependent succinate-semialdehyde dehydrogenase [Nocardioides caldifontis]|uniref:NAD-dependent succinate-semialdehyde dehydrogenase n=1 Tax=Nocardioides caldifontis TaxID=2588938 RepID=UPI0011E03B34|nr:NAD-dependent succinate-semialdehyde dehydrogenase [Nocardioides caldifontis]